MAVFTRGRGTKRGIHLAKGNGRRLCSLFPADQELSSPWGHGVKAGWRHDVTFSCCAEHHQHLWGERDCFSSQVAVHQGKPEEELKQGPRRKVASWCAQE